MAPSGSPTASDDSSSIHPETPDQPVGKQDVTWQRSDVVTSGGFVTQSGYVVASADGDVVFASGVAGRRKRAITAVRRATGETFWERTDLGGDPYVQFAERGGVAVNLQYRWMALLDSGTGDTVWSLQLPDGYGVTRAIRDGRDVFVAASAPAEGDEQPPLVYRLDHRDGSTLWNQPLQQGSDLQWHAPVITEDLVVVQAVIDAPTPSEAVVYALDRRTGSMLWRTTIDTRGFSSLPAVHVHGHVVIADADGTVALRTGDGTVAWRRADLRPVVTHGGFVLLSDGLNLVVVDAATDRIIDAFRLEPEIETGAWAGSIASGGSLVVAWTNVVVSLHTPELAPEWCLSMPAGVSQVAPGYRRVFAVADNVAFAMKAPRPGQHNCTWSKAD